MPSLDLLVRAHPAAAAWAALWLVGLLALLLSRRRLRPGPAVAGWAVGTITLLELVPPRGGPVAGIARTCDLRPEHLLWPWDWFRQDPRMGLVALTVVTGLAVSRRPRWWAPTAALPLLLEGVQYAIPGLARACSAPDVLHAWMGLAVGIVVGAAVLRVAGFLRGALLRVAATCVALGVAVTAVAGWSGGPGPVDPDAMVRLLGPRAQQSELERAGADDLAWLAAGTVPGAGTAYEEMGRAALRDLRSLSENLLSDGGLPPAGPAENWGYFWPRDGAFVAVALVRTGHADRAVQLLSRTGDLYLDPMYGFDARYQLSGARVRLDPRRAQVDGCGWVLWAIHETTRSVTVPPAVDDLRTRCTDQLLRATGGGSHLPAPGQDYWEQTTYEHLLGTSAPVATGLRSAEADYRALGQRRRADQVGAAAGEVRGEIERFFGPGYQRAGTHGGLDAATAMLMPPFDPDPPVGLRDAWWGYQRDAARPGGGLAPGSAWKEDGISWTPEVALVAYTAAASGEEELASRWLDWLDQHRAPWGSLPEKVDARGRPGGPAPLAWTSALVVLTLDELAGPAGGGG